MTSHEERAREWLLDHGVSDLCDDRDPATSLAAEFAAVEDATIGKCINDAQELERVLQKRVAVLEAALHQLARLGNGDRPGNSEGNVIAQRALSGEPTALLAMLEKAAMDGLCRADINHEDAPLAVEGMWSSEAATIAKRVAGVE